ncbi:hypothetical protein ACFL50_04750 [Candidatus Latescibacterota bacterium]
MKHLKKNIQFVEVFQGLYNKKTEEISEIPKSADNLRFRQGVG